MQLRLIAFIVALFAASLAARADSFTYTYTGNHFTDANDPYTTMNPVRGSQTLVIEPGQSIQGGNWDSAGTWTETRNGSGVPPTVQPDPSTLWLLTTGGVGLVGGLRQKSLRRSRSQISTVWRAQILKPHRLES